MTQQQAVELLADVAAIRQALDLGVFFLHAIGLAAGIFWGMCTWRLLRLAFSQRDFL